MPVSSNPKSVDEDVPLYERPAQRLISINTAIPGQASNLPAIVEKAARDYRTVASVFPLSCLESIYFSAYPRSYACCSQFADCILASDACISLCISATSYSLLSFILVTT